MSSPAYLTGDTPEELTADAARLAVDIKPPPVPGSLDGGSRGGPTPIPAAEVIRTELEHGGPVARARARQALDAALARALAADDSTAAPRLRSYGLDIEHAARR